jgi:hypothetical protein
MPCVMLRFEVVRLRMQKQAADWREMNMHNNKKRDLQKDGSWAGVLAIKLSLPLVVYMVYLYFVSRYSSSVHKQIVGDHSALHLSEQRAVRQSKMLWGDLGLCSRIRVSYRRTVTRPH